MAVINMSKNQKIDMVKEDGSAMKKIFLGINWDMNRYSGEAPNDCDLAGFVTDDNRQVRYPQDVVNWLTYSPQTYNWVEYSGDNRDGNDSQGMNYRGKHYDEYFIVDATKFPSDRSEFILGVGIYRAIQRLQNFGMVENASVMVCDYDDENSEQYVYDLTENKNFETLNAVEIGRLYKSGDGFRWQALGSGYVGGIPELYKNFGLSINEDFDRKGDPEKGEIIQY